MKNHIFFTTFFLLFLALINVNVNGQNLPSSIVLKDISGGTFTMGNNNLTGSPSQKAAAPEHQVTLSPFSISETEITNTQYIEFLNSAFADGLIQVVIGSSGPDNNKKLIQGTSNSSYDGKTLYTIDGTRVMKDHDDLDGDGNPFTGVIEPENPLNIAYIGFNDNTNQFYLKNPIDTSDCQWFKLCNYYDYGSVQGTFETVLKNDFVDWSGSGQNLSNELLGWTENNPSAATNLPTQSEIADWPVTFVRWWGAKAFADYYNVNLPTEAQWEYSAQGGQAYIYGVYDGTDINDANWNSNQEPVASGHVRLAKSGNENPFGLYNLAGNVWEWIADNYVEPYDGNSVTDPIIEVNGSTLRCWRGGSWNYHEATLQSSIRFSDEEDRGNDHFGFRIASTNSSTGLLDLKLNENFEISPNPANNYFEIKLTDSRKKILEIFDIQGKKVFETTIQSRLKLNTESFENGMYFIQIGEEVSKIIIQ